MGPAAVRVAAVQVAADIPGDEAVGSGWEAAWSWETAERWPGFG